MKRTNQQRGVAVAIPGDSVANAVTHADQLAALQVERPAGELDSRPSTFKSLNHRARVPFWHVVVAALPLDDPAFAQGCCVPGF